jgi:hypothetical protein
LLLGAGGGAFAAAEFVDTTSNPTSVAIADLNKDGHLDLLATIAYSTAPSIAVLLGHGDGAFDTEKRYTTDIQPSHILVEDFTEDGQLDAAYMTNGAIRYLKGNGDGTLETGGFQYIGMDMGSITSGDMNRDGHLDLVYARRGNLQIGVMFGLGEGNFAQHRPYPAGRYPEGVFVADFNDDGWPDVVNANHYDGTFAVHLNRQPLCGGG